MTRDVRRARAAGPWPACLASVAFAAVASVSAQAPRPAPTPQVESVDAVLRDARARIDAGQPAQAIQALERLRSSDDARVIELIGVAHYHAGDAGRAIETLAGIVERLAPGSVERKEAVQVLGLSRYLAGQIIESIPLLEETRAWAPDNLELAYVLGMAYVQTRQAGKARETWARSFGLDAESAAAHLVTAQMMVRAELDDLAEAELKQALAKDPRLPRARYLLAQSALFRGRTDEALALVHEELRADPADAMAWYLLGDAYWRKQQWDNALLALQRSAWLNPYFSGPYLLMGKAHMKKRDLARAEALLRRAIEYDPNNKAAHYTLGQLLQQSGRADEARKELEAAERLPGVTVR